MSQRWIASGISTDVTTVAKKGSSEVTDFGVARDIRLWGFQVSIGSSVTSTIPIKLQYGSLTTALDSTHHIALQGTAANIYVDGLGITAKSFAVVSATTSDNGVSALMWGDFG